MDPNMIYLLFQPREKVPRIHHEILVNLEENTITAIVI